MARPSPARAGGGCGGGPVALALGGWAERLGRLAQTPRAAGGRQQRNIVRNGAAKPCARGWWLRRWPGCAGLGGVGREVGQTGPNPARGWWAATAQHCEEWRGQALRARVVAAEVARLRWLWGGGPRGWADWPKPRARLVGGNSATLRRMARPSPARAGGGCGGGPVALALGGWAERLGGLAQTLQARVSAEAARGVWPGCAGLAVAGGRLPDMLGKGA
jgi:hypothetical protein